MRNYVILLVLSFFVSIPSIGYAADTWWFEEATLDGHTVHSEDFSGGNGYVVGSSGYAAKTSDYGKSWTDISDAGTSGYFYGVTYFDDDAYAVGTSGTLRKYTASTGTWSSISSGTSSTLWGIASYSSSLYGVGSSGKIIGSTNSGSSFSLLTSPTSSTLNAIAQSGAEFWAVGYSGTVVRKSASSTTFSTVSSGTTSTLWGVDVYYKTGSPTVWISGSGGLLKKSTNGGTSWETLVVDGVGTDTIYDIDFQGDYGIAATEGQIYYTDDGGDSWEEMEVESGSSFPSYINDIGISSASSSLFMRAAGSGFLLYETSIPSTPTLSVTSPTSDTTPTLSWTASSDSLSEITYSLTLDGALTAVSTQTVSGSATSYTWPTALGDDTYSVSLVAIDESGNESSAATTSLIVDRTGPTVAMMFGSEDGTVGEDYSLYVMAGDASGVTSCVALVEGESESYEMTYSAALLMWYGTYTPTVAGELEFLVECEDGLGHTGEGRTNVMFTTADTGDATAPSVSIVTPTDWVEYLTETIVIAAVTDNVGVSRCDLYNNGSLWEEMVVAGESATVTTTFEDSSAPIYVRCADSSGNVGVSSTVTLEVLSAEDAAAREGEDDVDDSDDSTDDGSTDDDTTTDDTDDSDTGADDSSGTDETELIADDEAEEGGLIKMACDETQAVDVNDPCKAVYFYGGDGSRHAFPNEKVYFTWYADFDDVVIVSDDFMGDLTLGANVTYRPGSRMVKFQSVRTVYMVSRGGVLRAVASEEVAADYYGTDWNQYIDDISDAFFGNYSFGEDVESEDDYDIEEEEASSDSIDDSL